MRWFFEIGFCIAVVILAGCGRVGFEIVGSRDSDSGAGARGDTNTAVVVDTGTSTEAEVDTDTGTDTGTDTVTDTEYGTGEVGLRGQYFDRYNFDDFVMCRVDASIDFLWTDAPPANIVSGTDMSVRWEGYITPAFSETYTFTINSDDGVRLWLNNQLVIDDWVVHALAEATGDISLRANESVPIRLEYFNIASKSEVHLLWQSASLPQEIVPAANLSSELCGEDPAPVDPPAPVVGGCLVSDDFDDGVVNAAWQQSTLEPVKSVGFEETQALTLSVDGGYIFDSVIDAGAFMFQAAQGDVDVQFRIDAIGTQVFAQIGLMMRDTTESDSKMAFVGITSNLQVDMTSRETVGGIAADEGESAMTTFPCWVRLVREGDLFSGYVSEDGVTWDLVDTETITMNGDYLVGIAQSSGAAPNVSVGTGDDFNVNVGQCE